MSNLKKTIIYIIMLQIFCSSLFATGETLEDPFFGFTFTGSGLRIKFTETSERYKIIGFRESGAKDYTYYYYDFDASHLYYYKNDRWVKLRYSLTNENTELKLLNGDGSFLELKEVGARNDAILEDALTVGLSVLGIVFGIKTLSK